MHILQLKKLARITGDAYFTKMARTFNADTPASEGIKKQSLWLQPYAFDAHDSLAIGEVRCVHELDDALVRL